MIEIWKPIPGYANYEASNLGNVRSVFPGRPIKVLSIGKIARYISYSVIVDGENKTRLGHRLIAMAWIPNPDNLPQVNHKNGMKRDNRPENLEWVTGKENIAHAVKTGLYEEGDRHHNCKLTDAQVIAMHQLRATGEKVRSIAEKFNANYYTVKLILNGNDRKRIYKAMLGSLPIPPKA